MKKSEEVNIIVSSDIPTKNSILEPKPRKKRKNKPLQSSTIEENHQPDTKLLSKIDGYQPSPSWVHEVEKDADSLLEEVNQDIIMEEKRKEEERQYLLQEKERLESLQNQITEEQIQEENKEKGEALYIENYQFYKHCPNCKKKLKKSKVKKNDNILMQRFWCKKCGFEKIIDFKI
jgi:phosphoenolpyruvate carboxylase